MSGSLVGREDGGTELVRGIMHADQVVFFAGNPFPSFALCYCMALPTCPVCYGREMALQRI